MTHVIMLGGIPGSGKSTLAAIEYLPGGYTVICVDDYRDVLLAKDPYATRAILNEQAWKQAYAAMVDALKQGRSVVFDATFISRKDRAKLLQVTRRLQIPVEIVYLEVDLETCLQRNTGRLETGGRYVPEFVIRQKWRTQTLPLLEEGFTNVKIIHQATTPEGVPPTLDELLTQPRALMKRLYAQGLLSKYFPTWATNWEVSQDNENHILPVHEHMLTAAELLHDKSPALRLAALFHDVGKAYTKEYMAHLTAAYEEFEEGEKVVILEAHDVGAVIRKQWFRGDVTRLVPHQVLEVDRNAHFYDHQYVSAFLTHRDLSALGLPQDLITDVYRLILYHMDMPFHTYNLKQLAKVVSKIAPVNPLDLLTLRWADKQAANWKPEFEAFFDKLGGDLQDIVRRNEVNDTYRGTTRQLR